MSSPLLSPNPNLSQHLTDVNLLPLISSASGPSTSNPRTESLNTLTSNSVSAYDALMRLNMGVPKRITTETKKGNIVMQSFLPPPALRNKPSNAIGVGDKPRRAGQGDTLKGQTKANGALGTSGNDEESDEEESVRQPPMLIGTIVAPNTEGHARVRAIGLELERVGKAFQEAWIKEQAEDQQREQEEESVSTA
jgi:hypothetical protein